MLAADTERAACSRKRDQPRSRPLGEVYERLMAIDAYTAEPRGADPGRLGFDERCRPASRQFLGRWKMRVARRACCSRSPTLLLDEPSNPSISSVLWPRISEELPRTILWSATSATSSTMSSTKFASRSRQADALSGRLTHSSASARAQPSSLRRAPSNRRSASISEYRQESERSNAKHTVARQGARQDAADRGCSTIRR